MKRELEKSLKRYLKRKVRITLGFVTAFAIMGNVGLAAETEDFIKAEEALKGLGTVELPASETIIKDGGQTVTITNEGGNSLKLNFEGFALQDKITKEAILDRELISSSVGEYLKLAIENMKNGVVTTSSPVPAINDGIIDTDGDFERQDGETMINNGLSITKYGQWIIGNRIGYNYGIINTYKGNYAQTVNIADGAKAYNYGIIIGDVAITTNVKNSIIENHGLMLGKQLILGNKNNKLINYGVISSGNIGQYIQGYYNGSLVEEMEAKNYGTIKINSSSNNDAGQLIKYINTSNVKNSSLKNYGLIDSTTHGQYIYNGENNSAENYGVIKVGENGYAINVRNGVNGDKDIANNNSGVNYGTVIKSSGTNVFSKGVTNKGIVILDNTVTDLTSYNLGDNQGIVIKEDGTLLNTDKVAEYSQSSDIGNTFTAEKTTAYVKGTNNKITEDLSNKVIGTVVDTNTETPVFKYEGENGKLVLENTVLTGYFKGNGTLLDVGNNDLTLLGDTKIVTSKDDFTLTDVVALNIDGTLKMVGNAEVAGKITGDGSISGVAQKGTFNIDLKEVLLQNANGDEADYLGDNKNYTDIKYDTLKTGLLTLDFDTTEAKDDEGTIENKIEFTDNLLIEGKDGIAIDGRGTTDKNNTHLIFASLSQKDEAGNIIESVKGDILLGASDDTMEVNDNSAFKYKIDLGAGADTLVLKHANEDDTEHKKTEENTFNYNVMNTENINLVGGHWHIEDAHIGFDEAGNSANINILGREDGTKDGELHVEINSLGIGQGVESSLDGIVDEGTDLTITANGGIKYVVGDNFNVYQDNYTFDTDYKIGSYENSEGKSVETEIKGAVIFDVTHENHEDGTVTVNLRVKDASEFGLEKYTAIYDTVLANLTQNKELTDAINYYNNTKFVDMIKGTDNKASAFYTTGYAVTKDVTDMYMDTVESFGRKAGAGEWLAFGKYLSSDTEFDGGSSSRGYDGDITGTVGMLEYGVNDTTSYGVVFGKGDTEIDITGGGKLDGDNTYIGGYVKHTTEGGIELLGNIGFTKSDLDAKFKSFTPVGDVDYSMISDGSSDADAITLSLKAKKPYSISETLRVEPMLGARYTLINQDAVESSDMNFRIDARDVTVLEGMAGADLVKDFSVANGKLSLRTGVEVSLLSVSDSDDARYTLYGNEIALVNEEEIADSKVSAHVGFGYEHENGVGVDARYKFIWTDKGDSSRAEVGLSYRF
jgi:hypothetical protein